VLYVEADDLTPAEFGDSATLRVGDTVVAIGDPLGVAFRGTMTDGIVSAINRNVTTGGRTMTLIQTNAALNSGNSGGPLINCFGQVIGINTLKIGTFADDAGVEGLGFAIPSVTVKEIVDQLIAQGYVSGRPALNLTGQWVSTFHQQFRGLPAGLYITDAPEDSDIRPRDILLAVDGIRVTEHEELESVLYTHQAGDTVTLTLYRGGQEYRVEMKLEEAGK
jgi:serine protease Do